MKKFIFFAFFLFVECISGQDISIPKGFGVEFHIGMSSSRWYKPDWTQENAIWKQIKESYDTYVDNIEYDSEPRIPKIIHQIWIGGPLPTKFHNWQKSWKKHHPDWEYKLWTDKEIKEFGLINKHWYDKTPNPGQKANIVRYEVLYRLGGVYVDIDFECLQPLDIFHHTCDFYVGIFQRQEFYLQNALMGSIPGNPILKECIETMNLDLKLHPDPRMNSIYTSGCKHLTRCFLQKAKDSGKCVAFPSNYFYPWPWYQKNEKESSRKRWVKPESFAIHYSAESWFKKPLLRSRS